MSVAYAADKGSAILTQYSLNLRLVCQRCHSFGNPYKWDEQVYAPTAASMAVVRAAGKSRHRCLVNHPSEFSFHRRCPVLVSH